MLETLNIWYSFLTSSLKETDKTFSKFSFAWIFFFFYISLYLDFALFLILCIILLFFFFSLHSFSCDEFMLFTCTAIRKIWYSLVLKNADKILCFWLSDVFLEKYQQENLCFSYQLRHLIHDWLVILLCQIQSNSLSFSSIFSQFQCHKIF